MPALPKVLPRFDKSNLLRVLGTGYRFMLQNYPISLNDVMKLQTYELILLVIIPLNDNYNEVDSPYIVLMYERRSCGTRFYYKGLN